MKKEGAHPDPFKAYSTTTKQKIVSLIRAGNPKFSVLNNNLSSGLTNWLGYTVTKVIR